MRGIALVTGATGAIGLTLVEALANTGYSVRALVRDARGPHPTLRDVETVVGDIRDCRVLARAVENASVVFHLAAKLHVVVRGADRVVRDDYEQVNVDATRRLAEASTRAGVRRFVYFSTVAVYGPTRHDEVLHEASPPRPKSIYAETKLRGETAAMRGPNTVVLRLAAVYGRHVKGNYRRLVRSIQRGLFIRLGRGTNRRTLVHEQDVARAAILASERAATGRIYNVTDGYVHELRDIVKAISAAVGRRVIPGYLPVAPARFTIGMIEDAFRLTGRKPPIDRHTVDTLLEDVAVSGERFRVELGFRPTFDLTSGWRDALTPTMTQSPGAFRMGRC